MTTKKIVAAALIDLANRATAASAKNDMVETMIAVDGITKIGYEK